MILTLVLSQARHSTSLSCMGCNRTATCRDEPKAEDCMSGQLTGDVCGCCRRFVKSIWMLGKQSQQFKVSVFYIFFVFLGSPKILSSSAAASGHHLQYWFYESDLIVKDLVLVWISLLGLTLIPNIPLPFFRILVKGVRLQKYHHVRPPGMTNLYIYIRSLKNMKFLK